MNNKWIIFSYSIAANKSSERVRFWRRVSAVGAVQLKTSLYVLPRQDSLLEHVTWLMREVEDAGGEAAFFLSENVHTLSQSEVQNLFTRQSNAAYAALREKARLAVTTLSAPEADSPAAQARTAFRKLRRELDAIRGTDYFPSGEFERTQRELDSLEEGFLDTGAAPAVPRLATADYTGKTWVTREAPYIDRLSTFWAVSRYVDKAAQLRFLSPEEAPRAGEIPFDMSEGIFSHTGPLITFEVVLKSFGIGEGTDAVARGLARLTDIVRCIDTREDEILPPDAELLRRLLDGYIAVSQNDHTLTQHMLTLFDAFMASFQE